MADHSGAAADVAFGHRTARRRVERPERVLCLDVKPLDVVEPAVLSLGHNRQSTHAGQPCRSAHAITASRTTPTLRVLVMHHRAGEEADSSSQWVPVISPLPFSVANAAKTGSGDAFPRGKMAVTPVRTGPLPRSSRPEPEMIVACPTATPATSVMALSGPGLPRTECPDRGRAGR